MGFNKGESCMSYYSVFDIGGTNVKYSVMDEKGAMLEDGKLSTPLQGNGDIFPLIIDKVKSHQKYYDIQGVALSVPGAVQIETGYVYFAGQVTDLMYKEVKKELQELNLPIELENDANCAALAEKWQGNAKTNENFICITVGTGIGGAIFINNKIFHGRNGMAGEFGLMLLDSQKPTTNLLDGNTFSRMGSTWNLIDRVEQTTGKSLTGEVIYELYLSGADDSILQEVDRFFDAIAIGTCNLIHTLAPEKVLFGGGISEQKGFVSEIINRIKEIRPEILQLSELDVCKFGNNAGQIGALYHFLQQQAMKERWG